MPGGISYYVRSLADSRPSNLFNLKSNSIYFGKALKTEMQTFFLDKIINGNISNKCNKNLLL